MKLIFIFIFSFLLLSADIKKAFSEGISAALNVIEYEKSQAGLVIPYGYCVVIRGKGIPLETWEEVKLESLALFLEFKPALFELNASDKQVLCLSVAKNFDDATKDLKKFKKLFPKLDNYKTSIEAIPTRAAHRIIPIIGEYAKSKPLKIDIDSVKKEHIVDRKRETKIILNKKSTKVNIVKSSLPKVYFIERSIGEYL